MDLLKILPRFTGEYYFNENDWSYTASCFEKSYFKNNAFKLLKLVSLVSNGIKLPFQA